MEWEDVKSGEPPLRLVGVHGKVPLLFRLNYELRYREGYVYLDKCGRILNKIQRDYPEWIVQGEAGPQAAPLVNMKNASVFTFSSTNLTLGMEMPVGGSALTKSDVDSFLQSANYLTALVVDQLGIGDEQITRIGFRPWFIFGAESQEEAENWLRNLGVYTLPESLAAAFGGAIESAAVAVVIEGEDRHFRVSLTGGERQAQLDLGQSVLTIRPRTLSKGQNEALKDQLATRRRMRQNPEFVALVDIDCYQENPEILEVQDFLHTSWEQAYDRFRTAVGK